MTTDNREQDRKLKILLQRLTKSPMYKEKLSSSTFSNTDLDNIQTLPLTTKEDLRKAGIYGHLAVDMVNIAQYHESTGTTGEPSASWFTHEDLAVGGRQLKSCGVGLTATDLVLIRFPYALALPAFLMQQAAWQSGAGVVPVSSRTVVTPYPRVLSLMKRLPITVMAGLPREMELLAEAARLLGMASNTDFPSLRAICVAGELVSPKRKENLEKLWGVPVYNLYGSTETANIAAMCEHGVMHIVEQDFIVEALHEDGLGSVEPGERGYAAITTLSHQGSPLLRYFNEDIISIESSKCHCWRQEHTLNHYGRMKDRIRLGEVTLDAFDLQEAVFSLTPTPDAWKVFEQENGLHFLLDSHDSGNWIQEIICTQLASHLRIPVTVEIVVDDTLLDRVGLMNNVPSTKPIYIHKRET